LIAAVIARLGQTNSRVSRALRSALGGWLVLLLLVATTFSVSHALHQSLHRGGAGARHLCLACSFAKGQVSAAAVAPMPVVLVLGWLCSVLTTHPSPLPGADYRLSPSRAPPFLFSPVTVAG
jgi:hypothetical protein